MGLPLDKFMQGPPGALRKLNAIVDSLNELRNFVGDGIVKVNRTHSGYTIGVDVNQLNARMPKFNGSKIHKAYCKDDAGATTTIDCYLNTDATGEEITVNFSIAGGGNCNAAAPLLADGDLIFVRKFGDDWYCITILGAACTGTCECAE